MGRRGKHEGGHPQRAWGTSLPPAFGPRNVLRVSSLLGGLRGQPRQSEDVMGCTRPGLALPTWAGFCLGARPVGPCLW